MRLLLFIVALVVVGQAPAYGQSCDRRPTCKQMRSCAEADYYFQQCGHSERDGDHDGIPCEDLCGKTIDVYYERRSQG